MNPEVFKLKENNQPIVFIIDNFYENPEAMRQLAMTTPKHENIRYWKGKRSATLDDKIMAPIKKRLEEIIGQDFKFLQSHFHTCEVTEPLVYHSDTQAWAGAVYLTPNAPPECGTSLWRSKRSGLYRAPTEEDAKRLGKTVAQLAHETYDNAILDKTKWELIDQIGNVYNRCVLWRGDLCHSSSGYFGHNEETQRLFQLLFLHVDDKKY